MGGTLQDILQETEDKLITIALAKAVGNRKKAAKLLGIHERTLRHKILERKRKAGE